MLARAGASAAPPARDVDSAATLRRAPLPRELYELTFDFVDRGGARHEVGIKGDETLGLPYGHDRDVVLALFKMIDDDRQRVAAGARPSVVDGEFLGPSTPQIARAMGKPLDGKLAKRRAALERLAYVQVKTTSQVLRDSSATRAAAARLLAGAEPEVPERVRAAGGPPGGVPRAIEEEVTWVLEYRWRTEFEHTAEGEDWIARLRVNPVWIDQAVSGWAAGVDVPLCMALSGPLAKPLHELCASEVAYGTPGPWTVDLARLRTECAMSARRAPNETVKDLQAAAAELVERGVLEQARHRQIKKGQHEFSFEPGSVLAVAALLRASSCVDLLKDRTQLLVRRAFGVDEPAARQRVAERPSAVHQALCYAMFIKETNPEAVRRSWSAMIVERVKANQRRRRGLRRLGGTAALERAAAGDRLRGQQGRGGKCPIVGADTRGAIRGPHRASLARDPPRLGRAPRARGSAT